MQCVQPKNQDFIHDVPLEVGIHASTVPVFMKASFFGMQRHSFS